MFVQGVMFRASLRYAKEIRKRFVNWAIAVMTTGQYDADQNNWAPVFSALFERY